uniref:Uncharacterized protein n=1 Tax=Oryza sativa subsp. japonica TaxID=39947 RepID=Q69TG6_ORYSJ|nr:hypothetical protein [Oryza sativa Japonica Group]
MAHRLRAFLAGEVGELKLNGARLATTASTWAELELKLDGAHRPPCLSADGLANR